MTAAEFFLRSFLMRLTMRLAGVGHGSRWQTSKVGGMIAAQGTHAASGLAVLAGSYSASSAAFSRRSVLELTPSMPISMKLMWAKHCRAVQWLVSCSWWCMIHTYKDQQQAVPCKRALCRMGATSCFAHGQCAIEDKIGDPVFAGNYTGFHGRCVCHDIWLWINGVRKCSGAFACKFGYNDSMQEASAIDATCFGSAFTPRLLVNRLSATATATANLLVCRDKSFGDSGWWHHHGRKGCRGGIFRRDDLGANCAKSLSHLVCWLCGGMPTAVKTWADATLSWSSCQFKQKRHVL